MKSSLQILLAVASLLVTISSTAAFSTQLLKASAPTQQYRSPVVLFAAEDGTTGEIDSDVGDIAGKSAEVEETPKVAVKCPDCDLCDGSGR